MDPDSSSADAFGRLRISDTGQRLDGLIDVLQNKLELDADTKILDYGCAKSSMMRALQKDLPALRPFLYDVSDRYVPFWEKFAEPSNWAVYATPSSWDGYFDIVTSFFALERFREGRPIESGYEYGIIG